MKNKWYGEAPKTCNICKGKLKGAFVDGKTKAGGAWAIMCLACHEKYGIGLGLAKGQLYKMKVIKDGDKEWIKIKQSN